MNTTTVRCVKCKRVYTLMIGYPVRRTHGEEQCDGAFEKVADK